MSWPLLRSILQAAILPVLLFHGPSPAGVAPEAAGDGRSVSRAERQRADAFVGYQIPVMPRPGYLDPVRDPTFGSSIVRISNDVGASTAPVYGQWAPDARHVYSVQQPWNSDNTLLTIENRDGVNTGPLILDGTGYLPSFALCQAYPRYDYRWHPSRAHPYEQINVDAAGTGLIWFDVYHCVQTRSWVLPLVSDYGIGSGEGNPSDDGRFVAVGNNKAMAVVDMDPQPPYAPYPSRRIGPVYTFEPESLLTSAVSAWTIDHLSISPSGRYVVVKFGGDDDCGSSDLLRVFEVDPATLALRPHSMASGSLRCCSFQSRPNGWVFPLKHADMGRDPFDHDEDVLVGGRACPGATFGPLVKVRLRDGAVTALTSGDDQSSILHVSMRSTDRPGWAYVSWYRVPGKRFSDEIVAVKIDGSQTVERLCHTHTADSACYRCEAHPVPSRDGRRVLFASNWAVDCGTGCGDRADLKDYVVSVPPSVAAPRGADDGAQLQLHGIRPNPARLPAQVDYSLASDAPARFDLVDLGGRSVWHEELGAPGRGRHEWRLTADGTTHIGVYWLRLTQAGQSVTTKLVLRR